MLNNATITWVLSSTRDHAVEQRAKVRQRSQRLLLGFTSGNRL